MALIGEIFRLFICVLQYLAYGILRVIVREDKEEEFDSGVPFVNFDMLDEELDETVNFYELLKQCLGAGGLCQRNLDENVINLVGLGGGDLRGDDLDERGEKLGHFVGVLGGHG